MSKTVVDGKRFSKRTRTILNGGVTLSFDDELENYIQRVNKFMSDKDQGIDAHPKDSPEWFGANIIFHHWVMTDYIKKNKVAGIVEHAYRLGELATLARTYGIESINNSLIGKRSRKKKWVQELVRELRKSENQALPAFYTIPEHESYLECGGYEISRKDETVFAVNDTTGKIEEVKYETFRRYFRES